MFATRIRLTAWLFLPLLLLLPARAADDFDSLYSAIQAANSAGSGTIAIGADITLSSLLPSITGAITIEGKGHAIGGGGEYRIFDIDGGSLTIRDLAMNEGNAPEGEGGGAILLRNIGELALNRVSFSANMAKSGGAILAVGGRLYISDSRFEHNCSEIATYIVIAEDQEEKELRRTDSEGCQHVNYRRHEPDSSVQSHVDGGAIRLTRGAIAHINRSTFSHNRATSGGAISTASGSAQLNIDESSFIENSASSSGGAIGAVWTGGGAITISNSSFVKNRAENHDGGAISTDTSTNKVDISNSTFSENRADYGGGAISIGDDAQAAMTHLTLVENRSQSGADAIANSSGKAYLRNSLISGGSGEDCIGAWDQNVGNLSTDGSCAERPSDDPRLGDLTGAPAYFPLRDRSPAIDYAHADFCLETDQLGTPRPQGGGCDIGAIEARGLIAAEPTPVPPVVCTLAFEIIAANRDRPAGGCPAGSGADTIVLDRDITLFEALPVITSHITIEGNGHTISGDGKFRIFDVDGGKLTVKDLTMTRGFLWAGRYGGAIRLQNGGRALVEDSEFIRNQAGTGGAIFLDWSANRNSWVTVRNSRFIENGNSAIYSGGAPITVSDSSFVGNWGGSGGAIGMVNPSRLDVSNSSFIGNMGSAIGMENGVRAILTHITIRGSGIHLPSASYLLSSKIYLRNSVLTGNMLDLCDGLTENINNFISDESCAPMLSGDPMLEESSDDSAWLSPLPGSPLIRAGHPSFCTASDQAGNPRDAWGRCDIGAIEALPVSSELADCLVTPTHVLNLRAGPGGGIIGGVRQGVTLNALARTPGWFQVEQGDKSGWISADYVTTEGDCA